ncbi:MAG: hypothetical protein H5U40_16590 [Polyangiaceae bacterium]|nr:hypothetical protein [Polyangiaceae bacterium]
MRRSSLCALLLMTSLVVPARSGSFAARALEPDRCVEALDDAEVMGRLEWMERLFERAQRRGRLWFWGWLAAHATVASGGAALAVRTNDPFRRDAAAIVASVSVGMFGLTLTPPLPSASLVRRFRRMPDTTLAQRREKLDRGMQLLARAAEHEERGRAWYHHAFALTFAAGESFFLGVRHPGRPAASIFSGAGALALLEAQIVTTPRAAYRAAIDFEYGSRPCMAPQLRHDPRPAVELVSAPGGLGLGLFW